MANKQVVYLGHKLRMKLYFLLQFKMLNRRMIDLGFPLLIAYTLLPFVFILFSTLLFNKIESANCIYSILALSFISKLSKPKRNDFLKSILNNKKYITLRILENIIYCIPFTLFLVYKKQFMFSLIVNILAIIFTLLSFNTNFNLTIPTPFSKKPFEYVVGFRKTFLVFPIAYLLTFISISVENFNLGIFSMLLIAITCFSYYSKIENEYFVWNFNLPSKVFLFEKTKTCLIYFTLLSLPIIITLTIFFFNKLTIIILFFLLCYAYLTTIVFAKYSAFPNEMNMSQGILIAISFIFPPMLLIITPLFYSQAIKKLNTVLE